VKTGIFVHKKLKTLELVLRNSRFAVHYSIFRLYTN